MMRLFPLDSTSVSHLTVALFIELGSGIEGWQEGAGSRRRICKKQSVFSVSLRREDFWTNSCGVGTCGWDSEQTLG